MASPSSSSSISDSSLGVSGSRVSRSPSLSALDLPLREPLREPRSSSPAPRGDRAHLSRRSRSRSVRRSRSRSARRSRSRSVRRGRSRTSRRSRSHSVRRSHSRSPIGRGSRSFSRDIRSPSRARHRQSEDSFHTEFSVDKRSTKRLRKLLARGTSSSDSRALRERYEPKFEGSSFQLKAPLLDSSMKRRLIAARNGNNSRSQTTRLNDPMEKSLTEIQLKIMDGIRPLLHLKDELDRLGASRSLKRTASTALSLVGNAFSEVTKRRRLNVLRQTDGRYVSLLEEKDRFSVKEGGDLFGRHFLRSMVRTAREEENLRSMSRSGGHNIRAPSNFNRGRAAFGGRPSGRFHSSGRGGNYPGGGSIDNQRPVGLGYSEVWPFLGL
ncbi:hypothetical protein GHT06_002325 [Daphnia sinensis]|uniref:Uncharacterized protein n=1 Tax=Daphnia sinensis TaxID=1820382 RepID=A0AAD5PKD3_9CRUS|nr:hypothetical protein GHT06_002325 [Daphnia sinensis]